MPEETVGLGGQLAGMLNIFIDPAGAVTQIRRKLSWLWPLLIVSLVTAVVEYLKIPIALRVIQANPPGNLTPEQLERSMGVIQMAQKVGVFVAPVVMTGILALSAAVLLASSSVLGMRVNYRDLFSLAAHGSLISMLQSAAGYAVLRLKGDEIQTMNELQPAFGLALVFHEGVSKPMLAVMNYFSIFNLWYIVILSLALAALAGSSRAKGFLAAAPSWLLGLLIFVGASYLRR